MEINKELKLTNGEKVTFKIDEHEGYIASLAIDGYDFTRPKGNLNKIINSIKWAQLNKIAIYTRLRFMMLKEGIEFEGIDCERLSENLVK